MLITRILLSVCCVLCYGENETAFQPSAITGIPNNVTNTVTKELLNHNDDYKTTTLQKQQHNDMPESTDVWRKDDIGGPMDGPNKIHGSIHSKEFDAGTSMPVFPESIKKQKHNSKKVTADFDNSIGKKEKMMRHYNDKYKSLVTKFKSNNSDDHSATTFFKYSTFPMTSTTATGRTVVTVDASTKTMKAVRRADGVKHSWMPLRPRASRLPLPEELDMAPARDLLIDTLRDKNRLCHRHVLVPEGPKYNSHGKQYLAEYKPIRNRRYPQTSPPRLLLPRCCNCCQKSVLGCE